MQNQLPFAAGKFIFSAVKEIWEDEPAIAHAQILAHSFKRFTRRDLFSENFSPLELAGKIFHAPFVLVSHGAQADPILNYGNQTALLLWEMPWKEFTRTPSRLTAEAPNRAERARLLAAVSARGFIDDYSGVRISKTGRRFKISRATVWNLLDENQNHYGQAALFREWEFL